MIDDRVYTINGWLKIIYVISNSIFDAWKWSVYIYPTMRNVKIIWDIIFVRVSNRFSIQRATNCPEIPDHIYIYIYTQCKLPLKGCIDFYDGSRPAPAPSAIGAKARSRALLRVFLERETRRGKRDVASVKANYYKTIRDALLSIPRVYRGSLSVEVRPRVNGWRWMTVNVERRATSEIVRSRPAASWRCVDWPLRMREPRINRRFPYRCNCGGCILVDEDYRFETEGRAWPTFGLLVVDHSLEKSAENNDTLG